MIDFGKIIKRAWNILWDYKVLWIFAVLLALTSGGGGSSGNGSNFQFNDWKNQATPGSQPGYIPSLPQSDPRVREFITWFQQHVEPVFENPENHISTFIWIGVGFLLFIILVGVITSLIRFPAETAIFRMVDEYEQSGSKMKFKQGWKLGWNRRAFRIWVIDLLISLPVIVFLLLLGGLGLLVWFSTESGSEPALAASIIAAVGCSFLFLFLFIVFMVFLTLLRQFFVRKVALEDAGIRQAFREGWAMFKRNWKSAGLVWLILLGFGIAFAIAMFIAALLLIPVYIILLIPALVVSAIPGLIFFGIASLFTNVILSVIIGVILALPFFFAVLLAPLTLLSGLYMLYESNIWTLTYREMKALDSNLIVEAPAVSPQ